MTITSTYKPLQLNKAELSLIAASLDCPSNKTDALSEQLTLLSARYSHILSSAELAPVRESKSLSVIDKAIKRYLNANTDSKQLTARNKLCKATVDYTSKYGEHRKWLTIAIQNLIRTNKIDQIALDRLSDKIRILGSQNTGNLEYSYLVEELLSLYEDFSGSPAIIDDHWYDKKKYSSALHFLISALPHYLPSEKLPNSRAIEKQITRYYERLTNRPPPTIR